MARTNNLNDFLTDVATAIKSKKGSQTDIPAANFDTEILNLPTGGGADATATADDIIKPKTAYIGSGKVTGTIETAEHPSSISYNSNDITHTCTNFCVSSDLTCLITFGDTIEVIDSSTGDTITSYTKSDLDISTNLIRGVYIANAPYEGTNYYLVFSTNSTNTAYVDVCSINLSTGVITKLYQHTFSIQYNGFVFAMGKVNPDICAVITRNNLITLRLTQAQLTTISQVSLFNERVGSLDFQKNDTILVSNGNYIHDGNHHTYYAKLNNNFEIVFNTDFSNDNTNIAFFNNSNRCLKINTDLTITVCDYTDNGSSFTITETSVVWTLPSNPSKNIYIMHDDLVLVSQDYTNGKIALFNINPVSNLSPTLLTVCDGPTQYYDLATTVPFWLGDNNKFVAGYNNGVVHIRIPTYGEAVIDTLTYKTHNFYYPYNANVTSADIVSGKIAYGSSGAVSGTITNNGELNYTPDTTTQIIPVGYTSGGRVNAIDMDSLAIYNYWLTMAKSIYGSFSLHQELEYIEVTSGAPYIDTNFIHTADTKVEIKFYADSSNTTAYIGLMGARQSNFNTKSYSFFTRFNYSSNFAYSRSGNETAGTGIYDKEVTLTTNGTTATYTDGINTYTITTSGTADSGSNHFLLYNLNTGNADQVVPDSPNTTGIRIYYCKIWEDNTLIRDFIPVRRNIDNELCMYDKISKEYYTKQGTGVFSAGPEIYTELEYIESTGTQYIDTGYTFNNATEIILNINKINNNTGQGLLDVYLNNNRTFMYYLSGFNGRSGKSGVIARYDGETTYELFDNTYTGPLELNINMILSSITAYTSDKTQLGRINIDTKIADTIKLAPLSLFRARYFNQYASTRFYDLSILENGNQVLHLIPVKRNSDGEIGLYDRVSGEFFTNQGTGTFIGGELNV